MSVLTFFIVFTTQEGPIMEWELWRNFRPSRKNNAAQYAAGSPQDNCQNLVKCLGTNKIPQVSLF